MAGQRLFLAGMTAAAALTCAAASAHAAEAYVCGPSDVVYVEAADLERMKRTHPCIAAFYGLKVEAAPSPISEPKQQPAAIPQKKPEAVTKPAKSAPVAAKPAAPLKASTAAEVAVQSRHASAAPAVLGSATTAPDTDFRNVRVLNARTPETAWFHHEY